MISVLKYAQLCEADQELYTAADIGVVCICSVAATIGSLHDFCEVLRISA